jgi:predicted LPLAT superfamily acyltransferase
MTLLEEIQAGGFDLANRDDGAIAAALSVGRTKLVKTSIGEGTILATLGLAAGNAFLDVIDAHPDFRHVKKIVARGEFDMSSPVSQAGVDGMVPAVLTQEQADALKNLAVVPDVISANDVARALEGV